MNTENQDQDFAQLQQLLKLKRYEVPPPRYFYDLSGQITSRIRAGKTGNRYDSFENIITHTPWLSRIWSQLEGQPALSRALAVVVGGLMVAGVFLMEQTTPPDPNFLAVSRNDAAEENPLATAALGNNFAVATPQFVSSTNLLTGPNLFERLPTLQPVLSSGLPLGQK